jgi:pimeloyl-CoA synthetase
MSILDWLGGDYASSKSESEKEGEKELSVEEMTKRVNTFMANRHLKIEPDFLEIVLDEVKLTEQEKKDLIVASYNQMPENGLTFSANLAYLDGIRDKLEAVIKKKDWAKVD